MLLGTAHQAKMVLPMLTVVLAWCYTVLQNRYFDAEQEDPGSASTAAPGPATGSSAHSAFITATNAGFEPQVASRGQDPMFWLEWALALVSFGKEAHTAEVGVRCTCHHNGVVVARSCFCITQSLCRHGPLRMVTVHA